MRRFSLLSALLATASLSAQASFIEPPWSAGAANSTYQQWDFLTNPGPTAPDIGSFNPNGTAGLSVVSPGFVTGSGNGYSFSAPYNVTFNIPDYNLGDDYQTVLYLQTKTLGNEIIPNTILANGFTPTTVTELFRGIEDTPMGPGNAVETLYTFILSGNGPSKSISLTADVHTSFLQARVDTLATAIPEASSLALLGVVSSVGLAWKLRRRRSPA